MASGKIFISYRREDTSGESGRLKDKLEQVFGKENIFYDVETLEAGLNFDQSIAKALGESTVLLAMIGPHWLKVTDSKGVLRLQKPEDWVRKEIAEALRRDLRVIPVLVNDAEMPDADELPDVLKQLSLKHAQELSSSRWNYDVGELTKVLEKIITKIPEPIPDSVREEVPKKTFVPPISHSKSWWSKNYLWVLGGIVGFLVLVGMCVPDETETFPVDNTQVITEENPIYRSPTVDNSIPATDQTEPETQDSEQFIPDVSGEWDLYLNGQKVSVFAFGQNGANVAYYEYDNLNQLSAEGQGQVNELELMLDYTSSVNNMVGTISLNTANSGQSWTGTIYFPSNAYTANVELVRN